MATLLKKASWGSSSSQNNTYDSRFPWLDQANYMKMQSAVKSLGLTGEDEQEAMNQRYRDNIKTVVNSQTLNKRADELNQQAYQAAQLKDKQADAQLRMTEAAKKGL